MASPEQEDLISQLCSITNTATPSGRARNAELLQSLNWDLQAAVETLFADGNQAGSSSSGATSYPPQPLASGSGYAGGVSSGTGSGGGGRPVAGRVGLSGGDYGVFWPLQMIGRFLSSLWYFLVRSLLPLSFLPYLPRALLPPSAPSSHARKSTQPAHADPLRESMAFIRSLESLTGRLVSSGTLPEFFIGGYKEFLRVLKNQGKVGCVIVLSGEHEDDEAFKREVLCDAEFIQCFKDNDILIWGGDAREREGYQVYQTLQLTTFPSLTFLSLLPISPTAPSSSTKHKLTVLTTVSGSPSSSTSSSSLIQLITTAIVPRTRSFLARLKRERGTMEETRRLREEQDRAMEESARKDRERLTRLRREKEELERRLQAEEIKRKREEREREEKERRKTTLKEEREIWRRYARRTLLLPEPIDTSPATTIRVSLRLPGGSSSRITRRFSTANLTLDPLFIWAETLQIPSHLLASDDPDTLPPGLKHDWNEGEVLRIFSAYPRKEVEREGGWAVVKEAGGSLVLEIEGRLDAEESSEEESAED